MSPGTGKGHLAQAIGYAAIQQGYRVWYREAHQLLDDLAEASLAGTRKALVVELTTVPLLIVDDLGRWKLPHRGRRPRGDRHAALRTRLDAHHIQPTGR